MQPDVPPGASTSGEAASGAGEPSPAGGRFAVEYGRADGQRRSNGMAIASLVLGVLGCVPLITGMAAILLGILGIRRARDPLVGGKGMAIAGLLLGIISMMAWTGVAGLLGYGYQESKPAAGVARQFLGDVSAGNINLAMTNSTGIGPAQLQSEKQQMEPFGALQTVSISSFNLSKMNGSTTMHLIGTATFSNGARTCTFDLVKVGGVYKVTGCLVQ